jgi:lipopolysaccharide biosynthesis glycosyltransferase
MVAEDLAGFVECAASIIARNDKDAADALLISRPVPSDPTQADLDELQAWAGLAYTSGQDSIALGIYRVLSERDPPSWWSFFQIGRINLDAGEFLDAVAPLQTVVGLAPQFAWGWYELCRVWLELDDVHKLATAAVGFARAERQLLNDHHKRMLAAVAHHLFESKFREEPFGIYSILLAQGCDDDMVRTRHAEYYIWKQDFETAARLLEPLERTKTLGDWGRRTLAQAYSEMGVHEPAREILEDVTRRNPRNVNFFRDYIKLLCEMGLGAQAEEAFQNAQPQFSPKRYEYLHVVLLGELSQHVKLLEMLAGDQDYGGPAIQSALDRAIIDCAYKAKDFSTAIGLIERRIGRFGLADNIALCRLNVAFALRDWPLAEKWLAEVDDECFAKSVEFRVRRFEFYCFSGASEKAKAALAEIGSPSELPNKFLPSVLKFHAENGDWSDVYRITIDSLDHTFKFSDTGYLLVRAIRKMNAHEEALRQIDDIVAIRSTPSLQKLRTILLEDLANHDPSLLQSGTFADFGPVRQRLRFKRLVFGMHDEPSAAEKKNAIYYCANPAYLGPAFVSISSLIDSNWDLVEESDLFVVIDEPEAYRLACRIAAKLTQRLGISDIRVVSRAEIVDSSISLRTAYGMFTGGQSLAEAAYYRIYFADYLHKQNRYDRALYIDSDTVVQGDLHALFERPEPAALQARLEVLRPEVEAAIKRHGFEPGQYFNSGVLAFNLRHPDLAVAIERSLHVVQNERDRLIFQDQCALNIGFQSLFQPLDERYNFFIDPHDPAPLSDGAIVHFLDRPKPWDPVYEGKLCRLWFMNWHRLARRIGSEDAIALYKLSNQG